MSSKSDGRGEVADFAEALGGLGRTVVIGGMLRDLCVSGPRGFKSDVDFVVHAGSLEAYDRFVARLGAEPNRFGGHAIRLKSWKVEVWPLQRTWAAVKGHVPVEQVDDLLDVTFFDWDAILYDVAEKRLIARASYFDRVANRVIDLNLEPNPNPLGNAVRALRYAYRWNAVLGERLSTYVARQVTDNGWRNLLAYERRSFGDVSLAGIDEGRVMSRLRDHDRGTGGCIRLPTFDQTACGRAVAVP